VNLVTVVIPTRDREEFLPQAVRSVRAQTHEALETVVVDDGSREPVAARFGTDPLFRDVVFVRHDASLGPGASRQAGVLAAHGEFVAFLDDDDLLEPRLLETAMEVLTLNDRIALLTTDATLIDATGTILYDGRTFHQINGALKKYAIRTGPRSLEDIFLFSTIGIGFVARRCVFDRVPYPSSRRLEDYEFQMAVAAAGFGVYYVHAPLARYRIHGANASNETVAMCEAKVRCLERALRRYPALGRLGDRARRRVADATLDLAVRRLKAGAVRPALPELLRALSDDPRLVGEVGRLSWRALRGALRGGALQLSARN
jgi:glycosyltransferase involved in cell wall biosynthesis